MDEKILDNQISKDEDIESIEKSLTKSKQNPKFYSEGSVVAFCCVFGIVFMAFLLIFQIWLTPIQVVGKSMLPTINASVISDSDDKHCDVVYYNKDSSYQNDDIVIIQNKNSKYIDDSTFPEDKKIQYIIKRVIACPGQTIVFFLTSQEISGLSTTYYYDVLVKDASGNQIALDDSYRTETMQFTLAEYYAESEFFQDLFKNIQDVTLPLEQRKCEITLKENEYFVMGDNRNHSDDSRVLGIISYQDISGEVKLHLPYGKTLFQAVWLKLKTLF